MGYGFWIESNVVFVAPPKTGKPHRGNRVKVKAARKAARRT